MITKTLSSVKIKYNDIITILQNKNLHKDIDIINELRKLVKNPVPIYNSSYNINKAHTKWNMYIKNNLNYPNYDNRAPYKVKRILDYGGNVGDYAKIYGDYLGLKKKDIYVVDIDEWAGEKWAPRNDITWVHFNDIHKIPDNSIDLITMQHTLHHIKLKYFPLLISFFNRVLTDNGILVLYEHDTHNDDMSTIVDLEHLIYDVVATKKNTYNEFLNSNYMEYFTINQWKKIFSKYFVSYKIIELHNSDNSFYMFFTKKVINQSNKKSNKKSR
jgi:ubiquinone/menaquinone biosynthesis C-methylase UbiE